jgi:uncharacterized protein YbjT (DUF2867 family)
MITVMGATGNTGRNICEALLKGGEKVRALGRSAGRLAALKEAGAEVLTGDATDGRVLAEAFQGADAVYTLLPPDPRAPDYRALQDRVGEATARALKSSGVRKAVFLSSVGADLSEGTGPIVGLHAQEQRLGALEGVDVLSLRAGYFFENFYPNLGLVKHQGINGGAIRPDLAMAMIASRDIATAAARALVARDWKGLVTRELLGPRDLTQAEATRILGARIGKPDLAYVQFPYGDFVGSLVKMGLSSSIAGLYGEMAQAFNEGKAKPREARSPQNTTPTRFEDFAADLARAYEAL